MSAENNKYNIVKIENIEEVINYEGQIYLFDIEQTILKENRFVPPSVRKYKSLSFNNYYCNLLHRLCKSAQITNYEALIIYGKHYKRELLEDNVINIINTLRSQGKKVYALTSGYPNVDKFLKMQKEHGIVFDHIICTSRGAKGPALLQHIIRFNIKEKCIFIDNHENKLKNVGETFLHNNRVNQIILLHYTKADKYIAPTKNEFIEYWTNVIKNFKIYSNY